MRKRGSILLTLGVLLLAAALGLTGYNIFESKRAQSVAEAVTDEMTAVINNAEVLDAEQADYEKYPKKEMPTVEIDGHRYLGVLEIPDVGLKLPVMAGEWNYNKLSISPCCYAGSIYENNMVIAAHNYRSHFGKLNKVSMGSELYFTDTEGNTFVYVVGWADIVQPTDIEGMKNAEEWDMTLFTCTYGGKERYTLRCLRQV